MTRTQSIAIAASSRLLALLILQLLLSGSAVAQQDSSGFNTAPHTGALDFTVFAERSGVRLDRQALIKVVRSADQIAIWQTTENTSRSVFSNLTLGNYEAELSAVGYFGTRLELQVILGTTNVEVVLNRDPNAVRLDVSDKIISSKARKETRRAVDSLKSGDLRAAQKHLDAAYKLAPSSADLNFLLGYLYFQKKDYTQAGTYLCTAAELGPHNTQTLTLLGRTELARKDYSAARSALERAVMEDADNWLPHNLLADAYLRQKNYDQARDEAQLAITKGQKAGQQAGSSAQLVLGQALIALGRDGEGIDAFNVFLKQSPQHPMADQVRGLILDLKARSANSASSGTTTSSETIMAPVDPLRAIPDSAPSTQTWRPPNIDDVKPVLAPGVSCPIETVIEESGKRVQEFVHDIERFAAIEDLFHQALDAFGFPIRAEKRKYDYVATVSQNAPGLVSIDEYRSDKLTLAGYPDQIASTGFATLALILHPDMRGDFELQCEGLGDWREHATWLVHFRQRSDRPNRMHSYSIGGQTFPVALKGRAWITPDNFQIVRIEADMVKPMPEIHLLSEHQVVEYGPVPFPKKNITLWLPKDVEIYFDFRKHRYYRRHSFDHFMLFSVDADEKRNEPVRKPAQ
jgi:tetratricopeptide (TPR) repeat protein